MKTKIIRDMSYEGLEIRINEFERETRELIDIKFTVHIEKDMARGEDVVVYHALILYNPMP